MNKTAIRRVLIIVGMVLSILFMLLLIGLETAPLASAQDDLALNKVIKQISISQFFAKYAYALAYNPIQDKIQTVSDLQVGLAMFEEQQSSLESSNQPYLKPWIDKSIKDYQALDAAVKILVAHPSRAVDRTATMSVIAHERAYTEIMYTLQSVLEQKYMQRNVQIVFWTEVFIESLYIIVILVIGLCYLKKTFRGEGEEVLIEPEVGSQLENEI